jgi:hypothetical protein
MKSAVSRLLADSLQSDLKRAGNGISSAKDFKSEYGLSLSREHARRNLGSAVFEGRLYHATYRRNGLKVDECKL